MKRAIILLILIPAFLLPLFSEEGRKEDPKLPLKSFVGKYEFFLADNFHKLTLFVENGQLKIRESRTSILPLTPVNPNVGERITFSGNQSGKPFRIEFSRKPDGSIPGFHFISGSLDLPVFRMQKSYLKEKYSLTELREDFQQFRKLVESKAVSRLSFISKEEFDRRYDEVYASIQSPMTLREFYCILLPLKERIGCGHTHLDYPREYRTKVQIRKFPLVMILINNRCYMTKDLTESGKMREFSEIKSVNGIPIRDLIKSIKGDISSDGFNAQYKQAAFSSGFQYYYANRYGVPEKYRFSYTDRETGELRIANIPAVRCKSINYSNRKSEKLNLRIVPGLNSAVMTIPSFSYYGERNKIFFDFVDCAFREIKEKKIPNVILDLRGNGGGDPWCGAYLVSYLEKQPVKYFSDSYPRYEKLAEPVAPATKNRFEGNLYVLINLSDFSTSGHFLSLVKFHEMGTFIGEETGSTYTCNGAVKGFSLKHTRLYVKLSTRAYTAAVEGFKKDNGIFPDHYVIENIMDLKNGRDSCLNYALNLIKSKVKQ